MTFTSITDLLIIRKNSPLLCLRTGYVDTKHKLQLTADIINFGNMLNSKWGIPKNAQVSNYLKILKYEGVDDSNKPVFSMYKVNGEYPTKSYDTNMSYSNCWKLQLGIKYFFN